MSGFSFSRIFTGQSPIDRMTSQLSAIFSRLSADLFLSRQRLEISLPAGSKVIGHNLGRVPTGWMLSDVTAAATVYRVDWTANTITLNSSAICDANLEVW